MANETPMTEEEVKFWFWVVLGFVCFIIWMWVCYACTIPFTNSIFFVIVMKG